MPRVQAVAAARRRMAAPMKPKPMISSAQLPGSGRTSAVIELMR
jgi:hypothetical protein